MLTRALRGIGAAAMAAAARFRGGGLIINEHTLSREETRAHVDALAPWFEFIHPDALPERLEKPRKKPFCLLTFDDGKLSNATETAPELERLGVPACFSVVTGFLDGNTPLWFDLHALLKSKLAELPPGLSCRAVKQLPHDVLAERLERACRRYGLSADFTDAHVAPMTWGHARDLRRRGFSIGAHGATHGILTRETREDALADIARSIERVTSETGEQCTSFAFPNGNYTAELARHAVRCGARMVMTTEPGWVDRERPLWRLPRVQLFGRQDRGTIELKVAVAATGLFLRSGDGTGMTYRDINRLAARGRPARKEETVATDNLAAKSAPASFPAFKDRIEREFFSHPVIVNNAYTRWFSRGEATLPQVEDLLLQFSVFSNHFLTVQTKRMVNAASEEGERQARFILMNECGVELDRDTGSAEGRVFRTGAAHINWLREAGTAAGIERERMGRWDAGTSATRSFLEGLDRTYGSRDGWIGAGASFAIENWAGFGIGAGPELEARNFWKELIVGLEEYNRRASAASGRPVPLGFFHYHFKLEGAHAANVWRELEAVFSDPGFDREKFIAGGREALDSIHEFWLGLDASRRALAP